MKEPSIRLRLRSILIILVLCLAPICAKDMPFTRNLHDNNHGSDVGVAVVQLFLVRHGETEGNKLGLTLGQSDSPLTTLGEQQAQALGESTWIKDSHFWRIYSSDLSRAEKTTRLILQSALDKEKRRENNDNDNLPLVVRLDARLREMSKGVKQGLPKSLTDKEAYELHQRETPNKEIPLLETDDDGWNRMRAFINEVIRDAVVDAMRRQKEEQLNNNDMPSSIETLLPSEEKAQATNQHHTITNINKTNPPYKVLIISHSALLRIFLRRLLGDERLKKHADARFDRDGHFYLPNTSLTILEIRASVSSSTSRDDDYDKDDGNDSLSTIRVEPLAESAANVDIVQLTWSDHLVRMSEPEMQFANGE